ncbi:hypothetical protein [Candidatus Halocynthiibacter alkanivorans]|uniref:hypothetical protein n=1 Tax=Candidatus Halocynthiibacter alkanivorans TaxID=2267619 RepID=UPI000DF129B5|nr:hypothetical protein [Candidatus Halocynthiibacter alkanivorans]
MGNEYEPWVNSWGLGRGRRPGGKVAPNIFAKTEFRDDTHLERRQAEIDAMTEAAWLETLPEDLRNRFIAAAERVEAASLALLPEALLQEGEPPNIPEAALSSPLPDDDPVEPKPRTRPDEAFGKALNSRVEARIETNRMAFRDQATSVAVTEVRQAELANLLGADHRLVLAYGLRTIQTKRDADLRAGMRIENPFSSPYHRDEPAEIHKTTLDSKLESEIDHAPRQGEAYYVSDRTVLAKMQALYGDELGVKGIGGHEWTFHEIATGIVAIVFDPPLADVAPDHEENAAKEIRLEKHKEMEHQLYSVGGFPSAYDIVASTTENTVDPLSGPEPLGEEHSNAALIADVLASDAIMTFSRAADSDHPLRNVADASLQMIHGLKDVLGKLEGDKASLVERNPIVANAIGQIGTLSELMQAHLDDAPRYARLYDLLVDEVFLLLSIVKPYSKEDVKIAAVDGLTRKSATLDGMLNDKSCQAESFLLASGMDAMSSAVVYALASFPEDKHLTLGDKKLDDDDKRKLTADYFEVEGGLLKNTELFNAQGNVMVLTLNPSTPVTTDEMDGPPNWDVANVIGKIQQRFADAPGTLESPVIAILDITVEKAPSGGEDEELEILFSSIAEFLKDGSLILTVNKSYQKYPSMGSGKILSGGATVMGTGPFMDAMCDGLRADETAGGCHEKDETQLACHFLTQTADLERSLLATAAENAAFVKDFFEFPQIGMMQDDEASKPAANYFGEGLPYLVIGAKEKTFEVEPRIWGNETKPSSKPAPMHIMWEVGVEQKMSFGFHTTSALPMPGGTRIALGQEGKGDLVELLYAVGRLTKELPEFNTHTLPITLVADLKQEQVFVGDALVDEFEGDLAKLNDAALWRELVKQKALEQVERFVDGNPDLRGPGFSWEETEGSVAAAIVGKFPKKFPKYTDHPKGQPRFFSSIEALCYDCVKAGIIALDEDMRHGVTVKEVEAVATSAAAEAMPRSLDAVDGQLLALLPLSEGPPDDDGGLAAMRARSKASNFLARILAKAGVLPEATIEREDFILTSGKGGENTVHKVITVPTLDDLLELYKELKLDVDPAEKGEEREIPLSPADLLRRQLALYNAATTVILSDEDRAGDDPNIMHGKVQRAWDTGGTRLPLADDAPVEVAFLPNIVASCALLSEAVFKDAANAEMARVTTDALMDIGMDGISNETKQALLTRRVGLIGEHENPSDVLDVLRRACSLMPYPEGAATAVIVSLPDTFFAPAGAEADGDLDEEADIVEPAAGLADQVVAAIFDRLPDRYVEEVLHVLFGGEGMHREPQVRKAEVVQRYLERRRLN